MKLVTEIEAAEILGCSVHKLQRDRQIGSPIPFVKIGRSVKYRYDHIMEYIESRSYSSTSEYENTVEVHNAK